MSANIVGRLRHINGTQHCCSLLQTSSWEGRAGHGPQPVWGAAAILSLPTICKTQNMSDVIDVSDKPNNVELS